MTADSGRIALIALFDELREFLARPDNDFSWSSWSGSDDALAEVDEIVAALRGGVVASRSIALLFLPTGPIQEVSLSSGWGEEFLAMADRCDAALDPTSATSRGTE